jgi:hypothetical protein
MKVSLHADQLDLFPFVPRASEASIRCFLYSVDACHACHSGRSLAVGAACDTCEPYIGTLPGDGCKERAQPSKDQDSALHSLGHLERPQTAAGEIGHPPGD